MLILLECTRGGDTRSVYRKVGTSLVVHWLRIQCRGCGFDLWLGIWDPACHGATKPSCHDYRAHMPPPENLGSATKTWHSQKNKRDNHISPSFFFFFLLLLHKGFCKCDSLNMINFSISWWPSDFTLTVCTHTYIHIIQYLFIF